ncbi:MAG TPA: hypothetical protein VKY33_05645 [Flavobacterium sp.]|nr:hypothetical protein [Flavobacterium sp.]
MKEKLVYLIAGFIVYSLGGLLITYIGNTSIDWSFALYWGIFMTIADFFVLRKLRERWNRKKHLNNLNNER